jgi:hypothetical protein
MVSPSLVDGDERRTCTYRPKSWQRGEQKHPLQSAEGRAFLLPTFLWQGKEK